MRKTLFMLAALIAAAGCSGNKAQMSTGVPDKVKPSKNVILMISDGTSTSLLATARWYKRYMTGDLELPLAVDPYICGLVQSRLSNSIIPDSAPAMSGYTTGVPSQQGNISIYPEAQPGQDVVPVDASRTYQPATTVLEAARLLKKKATGVVSTVVFSHATPAATAAHGARRNRYHDLGRQMANQNLDVMFGGGSNILDDDMREAIRKDGATLLENDVEGFRAFNGDKLWAVFNEDYMEFEIDRDDSTEPSLSEMTSKAIGILGKNPNGFFLMVEGSKVDYGAHSKDPVEAITEFIEFDNAIKVAVDFAKKNGNTTVVVLTDHGNSGITLGDANYRNYSSKGADSMFVGIKDCRISSAKLTKTLQNCREDEIPALFKDKAGIDLKPAELAAVKACMTRTEGNYMEVANSWNLQNVICGIFTRRTHIGFTSGNHTGEDVYLAIYNPRGERPAGIITNTQLNDYICKELGFPSREVLVELSDKLYAPHLQVFDGCELEVVPGEDYPTLFVRKDGRQLRIPAYHSEVYLSDTEGTERGVRTPCPVVYMQENGQFYLDKALAELFK